MVTCCIYEYTTRDPRTWKVQKEIWHVCLESGGECEKYGPPFKLVSSTTMNNCEECWKVSDPKSTSVKAGLNHIKNAIHEIETWMHFIENGALQKRSPVSRSKSTSRK